MLSIGINARFAHSASSGVGGFTGNLIRALADLDKKNHYLLYTPHARPGLDNLPENFEVCRIRLPRQGDRYFDVHFTESAEYRQRVPDVLYLPHFKLPGQAGGAALVVTLHDIIPVVFLRPGYLLRGRTPLKMVSSMGVIASLVEPFLLRRATAVATISQASRRDISRCLLYPEDRIQVIPNGFDHSFLPVTDKGQLQKVRRQYRLERHFILNFGGLVVRKNLGRQVQAFLSLPRQQELDFVVAGTGYWKEHLEKELAKKGIGNVRFLGRVEREDLRALVSMCEFSIYASLYEGFGFPILESLACATPVITSNRSSMAELLPEYTLRANPYSVAGLAGAMRDMLERRQYWRELAAKAAPALQDYTWERAARAYRAVFQNAFLDQHAH